LQLLSGNWSITMNEIAHSRRATGSSDGAAI
jgi:hypothetical protein